MRVQAATSSPLLRVVVDVAQISLGANETERASSIVQRSGGLRKHHMSLELPS
jgi:hypothetical protein